MAPPPAACRYAGERRLRAGSDVVFTNAAPPADCERANVGMHVLRRAIRSAANGVVRARIDCNDPRGCVLGRLLLRLHGRLAGQHGPDTGDRDPVR